MQGVVRYRVHDGHLTETLRNGETVKGSVHHPEMAEFAGLITRDNGDGSFGLVIFPPNRAPVHIDAATEGDGPHQFRVP